MSVVRKLVSIDSTDAQYLRENSISLSMLVRNNIRKLKENGSVLREEPSSNQTRSTYDYK